MKIEVHQRGGVLGLDRRYLVDDDRIEVIDRGQSRGSTGLAPETAKQIEQLAALVAAAKIRRSGELVSDDMETRVRIDREAGTENLELHSGDTAPPAVWDLISAVSAAYRS